MITAQSINRNAHLYRERDPGRYRRPLRQAEIVRHVPRSRHPLSLTMYRAHYVVRHDDAFARLTLQQGVVLSALLRGPVTRDDLISLVWPDPDDEPEDVVHVLDVVRCHVRGRLKAAGIPWTITTPTLCQYALEPVQNRQ